MINDTVPVEKYEALRIEYECLKKESEHLKNEKQNELKPCPFCGGKAFLFVDDGVRVMCEECNSSTKILIDRLSGNKPMGNATNRVIEIWNRRPD